MSPSPQGPHYHQGPPFPHGGIANPWLGPHSVYHVNIQDPKQRRMAFDNVKKHTKEVRESSSSCTFVGISDTQERPCLFQ